MRIVGFTSTEEVDEEDEPRAYRQQPFHQRIIVASAGSAMHFLIALVLALIVVLGFGQPTNNYTVAGLEHWGGRTTPAALAGLKAGDTIVSINGKTFSNPNAMTRRRQGLDRQADRARCPAGRSVDPRDRDAREREGRHG